MCRLFGMLSVDASFAHKYLLEDPCSLYVQSKVDPKRLQGDGWGLGFYINGIANLIKSDKPVYMEYEKFASAIRNANSTTILAHIRRASNPRHLPREKIISIENSQPFKHENYIFAHNGTINIPDEVAEHLGEWKKKLRSLNDSEVYFWYLAKETTNGASFPEAIKSFYEMLSQLWEKNSGKYPDKSRPFVGLNVIFSDGKNLYAYCKYDKDDESAKSLCTRDKPAFQMSYLINSTSLVVASEETNLKDRWQTFKSGQLLTAEVAEEKISINLIEI